MLITFRNKIIPYIYQNLLKSFHYIFNTVSSVHENIRNTKVWGNETLPTSSKIADGGPYLLDLRHEKVKTNSQSYTMIIYYFYLLGDPDEIGIPKTNTWYFNGYETDKCFDKYFKNPTENRPPTCYIGFPCTKVGIFVSFISWGLFFW